MDFKIHSPAVGDILVTFLLGLDSSVVNHARLCLLFLEAICYLVFWCMLNLFVSHLAFVLLTLTVNPRLGQTQDINFGEASAGFNSQLAPKTDA